MNPKSNWFGSSWFLVHACATKTNDIGCKAWLTGARRIIKTFININGGE